MFILNVGPVNPANANNNIEQVPVEDEEQGQTGLPYQVEDSYDGTLPPATSPFQPAIGVLPRLRERRVPPQPAREESSNENTNGSSSREPIINIDSFVENPAFATQLRLRLSNNSDYVRALRELLGNSQQADEIMQNLLALRERDDKEARDMDLVCTILTFSTTIPTETVALLEIVMGSLTDSARAFAAAQIPGIIAWALECARKIARETGDTSLAREAESVLNGVSLDNCSSEDGAPPGMENVNQLLATNQPTVPTQVVDLNEWEEMVSLFFAEGIDDDSNCQETCNNVEYNFSQAQAIAKEGSSNVTSEANRNLEINARGTLAKGNLERLEDLKRNNSDPLADRDIQAAIEVQEGEIRTITTA
ncbi:MAG: hypothetical protein HY094_03220 [Candidatus Melainabacteria bacterium]|nr:hypothetical protein [Candidatus Melainabacteria bacterium]